MAKKISYRIKNWKEYDAALVRRGSVTLWVSDDALDGWIFRGRKARGHPFVFSDASILCALTVRAVFRLPLRQTEGFLRSVFGLLGTDLPVPDYSTLCLRGKTLRVPLPRKARGPLHLLLDSTGLRIGGDGERRWKHGRSFLGKWRKFSLGIDAQSQEIVVQELTLSRTSDATAGERLLRSVPALASVTADGAYDKLKIYQACARRQALPVIPPQKRARIRSQWKDPRDGRWKTHIPAFAPRHAAIRAIRSGGRKRWKIESGYHRRSLAETGIFRLKRIFGRSLSSTRMARQRTEIAVRCRALNLMTALGMPEGEAVT